jgi:hypothetical protein
MFERHHLKGKMLGRVMLAFYLNHINGRITVQASLDKKVRTTSKITRAKNIGGLRQVVKCHSKHEALSSNPSIVQMK